MRKLLLVLLPALAACTHTSDVPSTGYVNSTQVMQRYHGTLAKRRQIEAQARRWQRSLDSLTAALPAARAAAQGPEGAPVARYRATLQQKLQAASQQADRELLTDVNRYLKEYGQQHHYDFIFGANESGTIVYAAPGKDLTDEVLRGLNQQYDQRLAAGH